LVKRIEINFEDVNIVFRVKELPDSFHMEKNQCLQCCCRGRYDGSWWYDSSWRYDGSRQHDDKLVIPLRVSG
ncbi:MAG: hypothetical protein ACRC6C_06820, partial [Wolbachia pipientis]